MSQKEIYVIFAFDGKEFNLDKITPEYVEGVIRKKGLVTKGVEIVVKELE